jgi:hypothetical protein
MAYDPVFPALLQPIASTLLPKLTVGELSPAHEGFIVRVQSQPLSVPSRVYYDLGRLRELIKSSDEDERTLALCLGTRHWDGYVREECLREVIRVDRPWVVPFAVHLVGEYVVEIVQVIAATLGGLNRVAYGEFVQENPKFMATIRRRVTSYWSCYYRTQFPEFEEYPAFRVLQEIEGMREIAP